MTADSMSIAVLIAVFSGVFGIAIGSFLNVVVYRVPLGMSLVAPASACPNCKTEIRKRDNVPVLSWLLLRGKCRDCGEPISARYPLVEAGTAVFFLAVAAYFSHSVAAPQPTALAISNVLALVAYLYLVAITVALALIDLETHTLPNRIVLPGYAVAGALFLAASIVAGNYDALIRAGIGMSGLWLLYAILAFSYPRGMGFGDVKLAGVLGLFLGWAGWGPLLIGAFAAFLLGGIFSIVLLAAKKANRKSGIPFGPWMLAGAWVGIVFGNQLWGGYLSLIGLTA
jgi:leader peptidase (prepilin peptidase)/N-methyltransferase